MIPGNNVRAVIALGLIPSVGANRIRQLVSFAGSACDVFNMELGELLSIPGIGQATASGIKSFNSWSRVDAILEKSARHGYRMLITDDQEYPGRLAEIHDPPVILWCRGEVKTLGMDGISVIGTRSPSHYGKQMAASFTEELVGYGFCIVSGLAYGIDSIAHRVAVDKQAATIAVLGSGPDRIYPTENIPLANRILDQGGAIITEFPPGTKPDAANFPVRNRIVSEGGGSMITANLALEQGREVFVVPHPATSAKGVGCNSLIKKGWGKLVQNIDDILEELPFRILEKRASAVLVPAWQTEELTPDQKKICEFLNEYGIMHIDQISRLTGKPVSRLLGIMLELELKGIIRSGSGKQFRLK
jgi:DNA processing protein